VYCISEGKQYKKARRLQGAQFELRGRAQTNLLKVALVRQRLQRPPRSMSPLQKFNYVVNASSNQCPNVGCNSSSSVRPGLADFPRTGLGLPREVLASFDALHCGLSDNGPTPTNRARCAKFNGYYRHQFEDAWSRYLGQGVNETKQRNNPTVAGTSAAFQNETAKDDVSDEKCEKPLPPSDCSGVSFQKGENGRVCAQCGAGGDDLQPHGHNGRAVWLHPECAKFWREQAGHQTDLDIPGFLDRRGRA
jgi:hypothetical protein